MIYFPAHVLQLSDRWVDMPEWTQSTEDVDQTTERQFHKANVSPGWPPHDEQ